MSQSKHTDGPWTAHVMPGEVTVEAPCGRMLYMATIDGDDEAIADAHLIAAAPDLLAALQRLVAESVHPYDGGEYEDGEWIALDDARAALAKANGGAA